MDADRMPHRRIVGSNCSSLAVPTKFRSQPSWLVACRFTAATASVCSTSSKSNNEMVTKSYSNSNAKKRSNRSSTTHVNLRRRQRKGRHNMSSSLFMTFSRLPLFAMLLFFVSVLGFWLQRKFFSLSSFRSSSTQWHRHPSAALQWENQYNVVHVIQTRFMQFQPDLVELGRARLRLFKAITLPSVVQQSQLQFLWIIRTDPLLVSELRDELIAAVADYDNIILVGSNDNPEGFKSGGCIADMLAPTANEGTDNNKEQQLRQQRDPIWSGSLETVLSYHQAAQSHIILETRLDADDGLLLDFVDIVQADAARRLITNGWIVFCALNHLEWQYASPWTNETMTGAIIGLRTKYCITAGLTWGYSVGSDRTSVPVSHHLQIHGMIPECAEAIENEDEPSATTTTEGAPWARPRNKCLVRVELPNKFPAALRARCPTSAGMQHMVTTGFFEDKDKAVDGWLPQSKWKLAQDELFQQLPDMFGIQAQDLWDVRAYLAEHLAAVLTDALRGQCTKGHSCKKESKELLNNLLDASKTKV